MKSAASISRLYDCEVVHARNQPVRHAFTYRYFSFCIDLDEITNLSVKSRLFGLQRWKVFRFAAEDYIFGGPGKTPQAVKEGVIAYVRSHGESRAICRVEFVGSMRTFGYSFNPAAFYFCYGEDEALLCGIVEVTNTFGEKKAYFVPARPQSAGLLQGATPKLFYVSPFVDLDSIFEFALEAPTQRLRLGITSKRVGSKVVEAWVTGQRVELSDRSLLVRLIRYPWVTAAVIARIHYQAARLYLKKVPFIRKKDRLALQKGGLS